ncbi:hypothetical protein VS55_004773 [Salmonella enterica subsp. enterica serovar Othmarschen]|nr:hypothetical protein [Salmonella enterica subsp. enterica serovar Othmarschen]
MASRINTMAHTALAVFLCVKHSHIRIMVGCAGEPKGSPGSLCPVTPTLYVSPPP